MKKKSIAYLMHVDWNWIKQRPHYLAEYLSKYYDIDLYFVRNVKNRLTFNPLRSSINLCGIIRKVPFSARLKTLGKLENAVNRRLLKVLYKKQYDYIWITSPIILHFVDLDKLSGKVIYDCMDDVLAFNQEERNRETLYFLEQYLLLKASFVFVSSEYLKLKMIQRNCTNPIQIINNAVEPALFFITEKPKITAKDYNIFYFGTISAWFDVELLIKVLDEVNDVVFTLVGPKEIEIPENERIKYLGPIDHEKLRETVENADAFIMPFLLNEVVLAVDPVKIYEYLTFNKPIYAIRYGEMEKFNGFVQMYNNQYELIELIKSYRKNPFNVEQIKDFINKNTWQQRVLEISKVMESI